MKENDSAVNTLEFTSKVRSLAPKFIPGYRDEQFDSAECVEFMMEALDQELNLSDLFGFLKVGIILMFFLYRDIPRHCLKPFAKCL